MRVAKFCKQNVQLGGAREAVDILRRDYHEDVEVLITDCFRRCLECRAKPFCRIQLTTVEAKDAKKLVDEILHTVMKIPSNV
jgi:uncharacterized protein YuzB (UPF0349 family)